jgi:SsrA-binding protein
MTNKDAKKSNICIENKKARYDYFIEDTLECGIELRGNEIKSIRDGSASIKEAWVSIDNGQLTIKQMHITPWRTANSFDVDENRNRRLLAHRKQISDFERKIQRDGYTLVPLKVYINSDGRCKVIVGLAKGKHDYDKRQTEKDKQAKRDIDRALKSRR